MDTTVQFLFNALIGIGLCVPRVLVALYFVPLFAFNQVQGAIKTAIAIAISLPITVSTVVSIKVGDINMVTIVLLMLKEALLGFIIGYLFAIPFWIFQSLGALIDNQRGALSAGYLNPASGPDASMLGDLFNKALVLIFIQFGVFSAVFSIILESYAIWMPLDSIPEISSEGFHLMIEKFSHLTKTFVLYAGPVVLVLLLVEGAFAILGAYSPQLQVYFMAMPAKALFALIVIVAYFDRLVELGIKEGDFIKDTLSHLKMIFGTA